MATRKGTVRKSPPGKGPPKKARKAGGKKAPTPPLPDPEEEKDAPDNAGAEHEQPDSTEAHDLIQAEQKKAEERGTDMSGECEELKGKSLEERLAVGQGQTIIVIRVFRA